jgi:Protein of unknown function (DUF3984)
VRSVPTQLNFQITPLTSSRPADYFTPTSGTSSPSVTDSPNGLAKQTRRSRTGSKSSGARSPAAGHSTGDAYEDHPHVEMKRSSSTFFLSSLPSYQHDWTYRHGARVAAEGLEEQGRSWLVSRASSTDIVAQTHLEDYEEEDLFHRHTADLEILDIGEMLHEYPEESEQVNWTKWIRTFMEFGDESEDEEIEILTRRKRTVSFVDGEGEVTSAVVQRARERDEEHGLDGWMDGAAYLTFLAVHAFEKLL